MSIFCSIKSCLEQLLENGELDTAKLCLLEDSMSSSECPAPVPPLGLDKANNTLVVEGDKVANYPSGQNISLLDANGQNIGNAVSAGGATYDSVNDLTTIPLQSCEMDDGKDPSLVTSAKPVTQLVMQAQATVKKFAAKRSLKESVKKS